MENATLVSNLSLAAGLSVVGYAIHLLRGGGGSPVYFFIAALLLWVMFQWLTYDATKNKKVAMASSDRTDREGGDGTKEGSRLNA